MYLTRVDGERFVLVWRDERCHCFANVDRRDRREFSAKHDLLVGARRLLEHGQDIVEHFITNVLAFAIAIEPQHDVVGAARFNC